MDSVWEQEKLEARKMLEKRAESHPSTAIDHAALRHSFIRETGVPLTARGVWRIITPTHSKILSAREPLFGVIGVLYAINAVGGMPNFIWGVTPDMVDALESVRLPVMLALALPIFAILAWVKGWWKLAARLYYTFVILAIYALIWWTYYWNLLGFRM